MELQRKCQEKIRDWFLHDHRALLVKGARQVGKTHIIRRVLRELNCDYLEINLIETPAAVDILKQASTIDSLIIGLSTISGHTLHKGRSILFIDEVQRYREIVTRIKFWVDEGSFRYILSGSLLGIELTGIESAPVGYLHTIEMFPLDFLEFLQTSQVSTDVIGSLQECFNRRRPVMDAENDKMLELFTQYLLVGGMPAAVSIFAETRSLQRVLDVHRDIKSLYKLDFTQYEADDKKLLISGAYDLIPAELLKQNRRFIVSDIKKGLRYDRMQSTFLWLERAGVAISVYNATEVRIPLRLNEKQSLFKLYLADTGMLTSEYGMDTKRRLFSRDSRLNAGGIFENAVAQELFSREHRLYYYNSNRLGELDFVIEYEDSPLPIEVKSGKDYAIHSALSHCVHSSEYGIKEAFVFANCNVSQNDRITYLPVYMCMFVEKDSGKDLVIPQVTFR